VAEEGPVRTHELQVHVRLPLAQVPKGVFARIMKTRGRCYDHNVLRFSPIFCKKWRFSQKPML
jgi:hypothetical protein